MKDSTRLVATSVIWIALSILIGSLLTSPTGAVANAGGAELFGIVFVLAIAGMLTTTMIWMLGTRVHTNEVSTATARAKAKRLQRSRVEQLIEGLEDDEVYELEALLLRRDDESPQSQQRGRGA